MLPNLRLIYLIYLILRWPNCIESPRLFKQNRPEKRGQIMLLHDNARPFTANVVKVAFLDSKWKVLLHHSYPPGLAPTQRRKNLFRSLGNHLRGLIFDVVKNSERTCKTWRQKSLPSCERAYIIYWKSG